MWFINFSSSSGDQRPRLSLFFGPNDRFDMMSLSCKVRLDSVRPPAGAAS
jgi:hypothetical protein